MLQNSCLCREAVGVGQWGPQQAKGVRGEGVCMGGACLLVGMDDLLTFPRDAPAQEPPGNRHLC